MAHDLETWGGRSASFVSARQHAWHRLGTVLPAEFDAAEAMRHAKLGGWNVRKEPLTTTVLSADGVASLDVPDHFATVRTNPVTGRPDVLGVVGRGLHPDPERGARRPAGRRWSTSPARTSRPPGRCAAAGRCS